MASKKRKPKKKPRVVRAWGVFRHFDLIYSGGAPKAWVYHAHADAKARAEEFGFTVRRVRIEVEP